MYFASRYLNFCFLHKHGNRVCTLCLMKNLYRLLTLCTSSLLLKLLKGFTVGHNSWRFNPGCVCGAPPFSLDNFELMTGIHREKSSLASSSSLQTLKRRHSRENYLSILSSLDVDVWESPVLLLESNFDMQSTCRE